MTSSDSAYPFWVDLHVHTRRYSPCAEGLDPFGLIETCRQKRLCGVVITEHNHLWSPSEIAEINVDCTEVQVYPGVEISSKNGHFIVVGLETLSEVPAGVPVEDILSAGQACGAVIIWAHPFLHYAQTPRPRRPEHMPNGINAMEVASSMTTAAEGRRACEIAKKRGWAMVGGSDAHTMTQVGTVCTGFRERPENEHHLAELIRSGDCMVINHPWLAPETQCS